MLRDLFVGLALIGLAVILACIAFALVCAIIPFLAALLSVL